MKVERGNKFFFFYYCDCLFFFLFLWVLGERVESAEVLLVLPALVEYSWWNIGFLEREDDQAPFCSFIMGGEMVGGTSTELATFTSPLSQNARASDLYDKKKSNGQKRKIIWFLLHF